ncbi:BadF/BadG/BcrA/BcrD ATPase family protein [Paenibacillus sp. H1-7]|uniref:N-acetylglucosamine kinase n=1 Tax=Paenibacillus sp. H1-7 TaxID=2282849 RepID=UPI001EF9AD95|nr:BadF/BadG/BcrA/BcrD ATPase family protein [Paenibacillus sp. H1-7]
MEKDSYRMDDSGGEYGTRRNMAFGSEPESLGPSPGAGGRRFIGIDGGGTKTACMIGDECGTIGAVCYGPSSSITSRPWDEVKRVLSDLIAQSLEQSRSELSQLEGIFLGMAGADRSEAKERLYAYMRELLPERVTVTIHNDAVTVLTAGTWGEKGIVLISGTGSIACGYIPESDIYVRVGGWGYLLGDEGSGYDIGRQTLNAVMKQHDGRGKRTVLTERVLEHWSLPDPNRIITHVYGQPNVRTAIAEVSKLTVLAAQEGDEVADAIVTSAVEELAVLAASAAAGLVERQPGLQAAEMPLVLSGGLFQDNWFMNRLAGHELIRSNGFHVNRLTVPPVTGCYLLALKQTGVRIDEGIRQRVEEWRQGGKHIE